MTEADWLACDDPARMLAWLGGPHPAGVSGTDGGGKPYAHAVTDRKLRLFAEASRGAPPTAQAALLRDIVGNPWRPVPRDAWNRYCPTILTLDLARAAYEERRRVECQACGGKGEVRLGFAEAMHMGFSREPCDGCGGTGHVSDGLLDPDRLAVLADALEDAGCCEEAMLRHLRGWERCPCGGPVLDDWIPLRGPHARGCWALDLILGRG